MVFVVWVVLGKTFAIAARNLPRPPMMPGEEKDLEAFK